MNKIYIGDQEINTGGGGQTIDTSAFVDVSTWDEHEKVIASALVDIKNVENRIEKFDANIQAQHTTLSTQVQTLSQDKADTSTVYTKTDIDKSDKVVAAALASLNERIAALDASLQALETRVSLIESGNS